MLFLSDGYRRLIITRHGTLKRLSAASALYANGGCSQGQAICFRFVRSGPHSSRDVPVPEKLRISIIDVSAETQDITPYLSQLIRRYLALAKVHSARS